MHDLLTPLDATPDEVPAAFPSPFDARGPHALAERAARRLQDELRAGHGAAELSAQALHAPEGGKMFGVLVVRTAGGGLAWLRAFSGQLAGRWELPGFVPPCFDRAAREAVEVPGERAVQALTARLEAFTASEALADARRAAARCVERQATELGALAARHDANRRARRAARGALAPGDAPGFHALAQQSRADKAERRRVEAAMASEREPLERERARLERRLAALGRLRRHVCRRLMQHIHDTYRLVNARGEAATLRALFAPGEPPSGAADCAGPKLLACAYALGLRPVAMAEFWWGAPPASGGRVSGAFQSACPSKCGPVLPFQLEGLAVAPARPFVPPVLTEVGLDVVYEDAWLVVVEKPAGLLSVPARDTSIVDSVTARLRARYPAARGPLLVHRLDLDTSGLLVAALDARTYAALQRQFVTRAVHKRYVAWVEGDVAGERGTIELALRVDLDDRPRQLHDPVHGKPATTRWEVLERRDGRTRVALYPLTGRTHQLRVHASHRAGLGAPIIGDPLYGHGGPRLLLHAELLELTHPATGERRRFERAAPF